ncbi:MAG: NAD(P)-dependent alcohol dehydrogenase [Bacteroidota bacterium]
MKAIVYSQYGPPEVLKLQEVARPTPKDEEVLVRIHATTVNSANWRLRKADPFIIRLMYGITKPRNPILGNEFAGEIVAVGKDVIRFEKGDKVFGYTDFGTYAEYVSVSEEGVIARLPESLHFEEAAAIPNGALTALHFLRKADVKPGQSVLIYGASGSVGTYAVQIAKYFGATVTAVCSTRNVDMVASLGADQVIDYTQENYWEDGQYFDIILDAVGKTFYAQAKQALVKGGTFVTVAFVPSLYLERIKENLLGDKKIIMSVTVETQRDLVFLKELIEIGKLKAVIDRRYAFTETRAAHSYAESGHKRGNLVVSVV